MSTKVLVVYGSRYGSTRAVAETVADELQLDAQVHVVPADDVVDIARYDAVVIGAGIYIGRLHHSARSFLERFRLDLEDRPFAVFAIGPVSDRDRDWDGARESLDRALRKLRLTPAAKVVFGGTVDPTALRFPFNHMTPADYRDWEAIRAWARSLSSVFAREPALTH